MLYPRYYFTLLPRFLSPILLPALVVSAICVSSLAQQLTPLERKAESGASATAEEKKSLGNLRGTPPPSITVISARPNSGGERNVLIKAEDQQDEGNVVVAIGRVE